MMIPIRQSIVVDAPVAIVRARWPRFVEWALVGPQRLACDELTCVDPAASGVVRFEEHDDRHARVVFEIEIPGAQKGDDGVESSHEVDYKLRHDLLLFKDYIEDNGQRSEDAAQEVAEASLREETQRGRRVHRAVQGSDPATPARPSGQAR